MILVSFESWNEVKRGNRYEIIYGCINFFDKPFFPFLVFLTSILILLCFSYTLINIARFIGTKKYYSFTR